MQPRLNWAAVYLAYFCHEIQRPTSVSAYAFFYLGDFPGFKRSLKISIVHRPQKVIMLLLPRIVVRPRNCKKVTQYFTVTSRSCAAYDALQAVSQRLNRNSCHNVTGAVDPSTGQRYTGRFCACSDSLCNDAVGRHKREKDVGIWFFGFSLLFGRMKLF